jgi:hypothetical protein
VPKQARACGTVADIGTKLSKIYCSILNSVVSSLKDLRHGPETK